MSDEETKIVFIGENDAKVEEGGLGKLLFRKLKEHGNAIAQIDVDGGIEDTYAAFFERAVRASVNIKTLGVKKGDIVAIFDHNHLDNLISLVSSFFLGAVVSLADPLLGSSEMVHLVKLMDAKLIFTSYQYEKHLAEALNESGVATKLVIFGKSSLGNVEFQELLKPNPDQEAEFEPVEIDDIKKTPAVLPFSSGSTGLPKGVILSHYTLLHQLADDCEFPTPGIRILHFASIHWVTKLYYVLASMVYKGTILVARQFNESSVWDVIEHYGVNSMFLAPSQAINLFKKERPINSNVSSLKFLTMAGNRISPEHMAEIKAKFPGVRVKQVWGMTETAGRMIGFREQDFALLSADKLNRALGTPNPSVKYKIVEVETGRVLGAGESGELRLKSDVQMNGYFKMDSSKFYDEDGYFKTGDMMYYDDELCFYYVDRIGEMFKYKTEYVYPNILEEVLIRHPSVKSAVVVGLPHGDDGNRAAAMVTLKVPQTDITVQQLKDYVERTKGCVPLLGGLLIVDKLPENSSGKVRRKDVKEVLLKHQR